MPSVKNREVSCTICNKIFLTWNGRKISQQRYFCSKNCLIEFKKGKFFGGGFKKGSSLRKGIKHTEKTKQKIREARLKQKIPKEIYIKNGLNNRDDKHFAWKGDKVKYRALHEWVALRLGKPKKCEHCDRDNLKGRTIHWANKSHTYKRDIKDWLRLCVNCHRKYDKAN